jgi:hypothetical protein
VNLRPLLFAADAKTDDTKDVVAQLAMNSIGTLILFILFHLDIRTEPDGQFPGFCWIPAVVYHQAGFEVYAHFPKLRLDKEGEYYWGFGSRLMSSKYANAWLEHKTDKRMVALDALTRLRTHAILVAERLGAWMRRDVTKFKGIMAAGEEASQILDQLIARARFEAGEYKWVIEQASKVG